MGPDLHGSVFINCQNKCVKELIEKGFDLNTMDPHGQTTLIITVIVLNAQVPDKSRSKY